MTIRTLVLSGGGGRGAFHAGVFKYLSQLEKPGVSGDHQGAWVPDIVIGTSIGAVNGAAIVQGISAEGLEQFWLSLRERDVQGLPPSMGWVARKVANLILKPAIGTGLPVVPPEIAMSGAASDSWPPLPVLPAWLSTRLIGRWSNLLDTGPLHKNLTDRLKLDEVKIAASEKMLIISATNVLTGEGVVFSNRLPTGITLRRIIASCSIPMVYPWTRDTDGELYWDGAVVANTPLGPALDAVRNRPMEEEMEVVIVMMTPWWESGGAAMRHLQAPQDFGEAMTWTLDWALLASFRRDLKMARMYNRQAQAALARGETPEHRYIRDVIVAPEEFMPVNRIIDYDEVGSRSLIQLGQAAAEKAFKAAFAG
ncbi:MAG TPA: patatin-like phospholipase family protein [Aggregatilineales bacterium]|nr:patatin-like phospholipase family protein [Aggregatilineales bacterium]